MHQNAIPALFAKAECHAGTSEVPEAKQ